MAVLFLVMAVSVSFVMVPVGAFSRTVLVIVLGVAVPALAVILGAGIGSRVMGVPVVWASARGSRAEDGCESDECQPGGAIHGFSSADSSASDPPVRRSRSAAAVW
jgi:hypothetical protein